MQFDYQGKPYQTILASDRERDGMGLELYSDSRLLAEVFYSDHTREYTLSMFEKDVPLGLIELFIAAKSNLLPGDRFR